MFLYLPLPHWTGEPFPSINLLNSHVGYYSDVQLACTLYLQCILISCMVIYMVNCTLIVCHTVLYCCLLSFGADTLVCL